MVEKTKNGAEKKGTPLYVKIFIALFAGIAFGYVLNFMGGVENEIINGYVLPFFQFIGDLFIKLIKMIVVPLVFFCIIDAALSLGDIKKLRSIGIKTIIWFLATGAISATIGLILANIIKPGRGLQLGTAETAMEVKELPGIYQTLLDLIPSNPFQALTSGEMMQIIVFSLFLGFAIISIGKEAQQLCDIISLCSRTMFKVIDMILGIIPYGVFSLMTVALAKYGVAIFGPVLKFILTDYLACIIMSTVGYGIFLTVIGKVNPMKFWRKAFEPWMIAFSTCTSSAALPVSNGSSTEEDGRSERYCEFRTSTWMYRSDERNVCILWYRCSLCRTAVRRRVKYSAADYAGCTGNLLKRWLCSNSADWSGYQLNPDDADGTSAGCIRTGSWNLSYHRPDSHIY